MQAYLDANFAFYEQFVRTRIPVRVPEATYPAWLDLRNCLPTVHDLPAFFANKAGVLLEGGDALFVGNAQGFVRLNLAMPRAMLERGLLRMADAVEKNR